MSTENPTPESNNKPGRLAAPTLIQAAFPERPTAVFFAAIVIGLILICMTAFFRSHSDVIDLHSNLVLCLGVAVVLAAFGGQATVRIGGIIMVGVAGVTLGLFFFLQHESWKKLELQSKSRDLYLQGTIVFDFDTYESLEMKQKNWILGRFDTEKKKNWEMMEYEFVIFEQETKKSDFITVALTVRQTGKVRTLRVFVKDFKPDFREPKMLAWELREVVVGQDRLLNLVEIGTKHKVGEEVLKGTLGIAKTLTGPFLVSAAFAQGKSDIDVPLMLKRLDADDTATRRAARDALSQAPVESIRTIMDTLHAKFSNYRVKLGICVALTDMLRADKHQADAIRSKLKKDDLNLLLNLAGDPDRTVRVYAAEFLYDLEDPRTTQLAIPRAAETSDDNARYNWLLVSQGGWLKLSCEEREAFATPLNKIQQLPDIPKTQKLLEKLPMCAGRS